MKYSRRDLEKSLQTIGLTREQAGKAVAAVIDGLQGGIRSGARVAIRNFGSFVLKKSRRSTMWNPRAGERRMVAGGPLLKFRPAAGFFRNLG